MNTSEINIKKSSGNINIIPRQKRIKNLSKKNIKISKTGKILNIFLVIIIILLEEFYIVKFFENMGKISKLKNNNVFMKKSTDKNNYSNFSHILPRINLDNKTIPSLEEIFNSRILYISGTNLTGEYIRFIRPINEIEEE